MLNGIDASQLLNIEFKRMVIRKLNELSVNYKKLQGNYEKLITNYISIKKDIETINKGQEKMNNRISELKHTAKGIKRKLDEAQD